LFKPRLRFRIKPVRIVCAASVLFGQEAFRTIGNVTVVPDRLITRAEVQHADALIVRSKTPITAELLEGTSVSFVGTATAGTDHMDMDFLNTAPIAWCAAPGCNANSVAEYVMAALFCVAHRQSMPLSGRTLGVIGVGEVGSRVAKKAEAIGLRVLRNDPPLAVTTGEPEYIELVPLLELSDIVSLHVPLTERGPFPTYHMADCHFFEHLRAGSFFINAARGEVMDSESLTLALERGVVRHAVLDVWEDEPYLSPAMLARVDLGTPHIAGYSFEGRLNGTVSVYKELCHFLEVEPRWKPNERSLPTGYSIHIDARGKSDESALWEVLKVAYNIEGDDLALRRGVESAQDDATRAMHFDDLRREYPARREFAATRVTCEHAGDALIEKIRALGFHVSNA